jgi:hypothetical protein
LAETELAFCCPSFNQSECLDMTLTLPDFPGFAVCNDEASLPWFRMGVEEALRKINTVDLGKQLLKLIADARPQHKSGKDGSAFPAGVHVIIVPQGNRRFMQTGFKPAFLPNDFSGKKGGMQATKDDPFNVPRHDFTYVGTGSCNESANTTHATDGTGTVCQVAFDSAQMMTRQGVHTTPFLVLAHELIHSYHALYGIQKGDKEERWTTGIGEFDKEPMSENAFRGVFKMAERDNY